MVNARDIERPTLKGDVGGAGRRNGHQELRRDTYTTRASHPTRGLGWQAGREDRLAPGKCARGVQAAAAGDEGSVTPGFLRNEPEAG